MSFSPTLFNSLHPQPSLPDPVLSSHVVNPAISPTQLYHPRTAQLPRYRRQTPCIHAAFIQPQQSRPDGPGQCPTRCRPCACKGQGQDERRSQGGAQGSSHQGCCSFRCDLDCRLACWLGLPCHHLPLRLALQSWEPERGGALNGGRRGVMLHPRPKAKL